jgi:2,3-bisphosphoglycerate-dependent phosphoglycerate mutase
MGKLLLIRHGQSQWNLENRFTGWVDVDLSPNGIKEAEKAAAALNKLNIKWDLAYTSLLLRAQRTLDIVLDNIKQQPPISRDSALNERHYGELQGLNKDETRKKFGEDQVHIWRRSFDVPPPGGESLKDTAGRTLPYFNEYIMKEVKAGKNIIVSAHGNSLRSIVMDIEGLSPEQILKTEIGTGIPYLYEFDENGKMLGKEVLSTG